MTMNAWTYANNIILVIEIQLALFPEITNIKRQVCLNPEKLYEN